MFSAVMISDRWVDAAEAMNVTQAVQKDVISVAT